MIRRLYTLAFSVGLGLLSPYFLVQAFRHKKYLGSLNERLGGVRLSQDPRPTIWIHAVSVGEFLAVESLVREAVEQFPQCRIVVSTTTATGNALARERLANVDVIFFPLDLPGAVARTLARVKPSLVCLIETEIWPNFLAGCARRQIPVVLVNGRISDKSYRRYSRVRRFLPGVLDDICAFLMQSENDADRIVALGAPPERVQTTGNIKYDVDLDELERRLAPRRADVERAFALPDDRPLVVVGSTSAGEEAIVAEALAIVRRRPGLEAARLLVAPRHPERFDEAEREFSSRGLKVVRRSRPVEPGSADVLLLDSIGELGAVYKHADVVFVGGSLVPRGGHNILEPALYARPVVVGPHTENFRQIVGDFLSVDAVVQLPPEAATGSGADLLGHSLADLLADPEKSRTLGERGASALRANRGASARTLAALRAIVETQFWHTHR